MKARIAIALSFSISCAAGLSNAAAQAVPCETCQSCDTPPCGCAGHQAGCCCKGLCEQAPPNPLAPGRPSPVPCCADGFCYPNPGTWGHYGTRWRRWPIEIAATTPAGVRPPAPGPRPDAPAYDALPPEEEDRRAPPPSAPRGKPVEVGPQRKDSQQGDEEAPSSTTPSPTDPGAPTSPQGAPETDLSPESIFGLPPEDEVPSAAPAPGTPLQEAPSNAPLTPPPAGGESAPATEPLGDPFSDEDIPPAPPFATPKLGKQPAARSSGPAMTAPKGGVLPVPQDDPPPAPPQALASASR